MGDGRAGAARLRRSRDAEVDRMLAAAYELTLACNGEIDAALDLAIELGMAAPFPGMGSTPELWELLATVAAADVTVARVVEPHLDALAILHQAPEAEPIRGAGRLTWGVFAAEASGMTLTAVDTVDGWRLTGAKPWCSLGGRLSHALITADTSATTRRLFAVDLAQPGVSVRVGGWAARGLRAVPSGPIDFTAVAGVPVGDDGWYLDRPGFAWGGLGVAAIWWGGAVGIARRMEEQARLRGLDQVAQMHVGAVDVALQTARLAISDAADRVDEPGLDRRETGILAQRTRTIVADAAGEVIRRAGHALGPAPLALDERHAGRVADLELYLRQHHAERDEAALGRVLLEGVESPW